MHSYSIEDLAAMILFLVNKGYYDGYYHKQITFDNIKFEDKLINDNGKVVCAASKTLMQLVTITFIEICELGLFSNDKLSMYSNFAFDIQDICIRNNRFVLEPILYRYYDIKKLSEDMHELPFRLEQKFIEIFENSVCLPLMEKYHGNLDLMEQKYIELDIKKRSRPAVNCFYIDINNESTSEVEKLLYEREISITKQILDGKTPNINEKNEILDFDRKLGLNTIYNGITVLDEICDSRASDLVIAVGANCGNLPNDNSLAGRYALCITQDKARLGYDKDLSYPLFSDEKYYKEASRQIRLDDFNLSKNEYSRLCQSHSNPAWTMFHAIRPVITKAGFILKQFPEFHKINEIEFGEYPQMVPDLLIEDKLEFELKRENLETLPNPFTYNWSFKKMTPTKSNIYFFEGKKYIKIKPDCECVLSNGKKYSYNDNVWIEYKPVVWQVANKHIVRLRGGYRRDISDDFMLITKNQLLARIAYDEGRFKYFPFSHIYEYMYKYMEKDMFNNMTLSDSRVINSARIRSLK